MKRGLLISAAVLCAALLAMPNARADHRHGGGSRVGFSINYGYGPSAFGMSYGRGYGYGSPYRGYGYGAVPGYYNPYPTFAVPSYGYPIYPGPVYGGYGYGHRGRHCY